MRNLFFIFLTMSLLDACTGTPPHADSALLRDYTPALGASEPYKAPFVADYSKESWSLRYLAASHEGGASKATQQTERESFAKFAPGFLIIEGVESAMGVSPKFYKKVAADRCHDRESSTCDEAAYAVILAQQNGIEFVGGEPSDAFLLGGMMAQDYTAEDLVSFFVVRQVPEWKREKALDHASLETLATQLLAVYNQKFSFSKPFDYKAFLAWYDLHLHRAFSADTISTEDVAPYLPARGATILNHMAMRVGTMRENNLMAVLEAALDRSKRVLLVYGSGHLVRDRIYLKELLGEPKNLKLYGDDSFSK